MTMASHSNCPRGQSQRATQPSAAGICRQRLVRAVVSALLLCLLAGCTSVLSPISSVPAARLPQELLAPPRAELVPIDLGHLRQDAPDEYRLDTGDVLAIYIEGVLGPMDGTPPVHFPERGSEVLPALGYPVPVREDGTIPLPMVGPILVRGQTDSEVEANLRRIYEDERQILLQEQNRIMVTLIRRRTHRVIVVREDGTQAAAVTGGAGGRIITGPSQEGRGMVLDLPAYQNDVLHALAQSGGLPGLNARNEVQILRSTVENRREREAMIRDFYEQHTEERCFRFPDLPPDPSVLRIPLRLPPGETPDFAPEDVILRDGDIVYVASRETEVFYTGGLLPGGQFPLPRDYDLDVMAAVAVAGTGLSANPSGGFIGGLGGANPTQLYVIRRAPCGTPLTISVDLNRAIFDPRERLIVQPGDTLILRHSPVEESANFSLAAFFTYGIRELFRN